MAGTAEKLRMNKTEEFLVLSETDKFINENESKDV